MNYMYLLVFIGNLRNKTKLLTLHYLTLFLDEIICKVNYLNLKLLHYSRITSIYLNVFSNNTYLIRSECLVITGLHSKDFEREKSATEILDIIPH